MNEKNTKLTSNAGNFLRLIAQKKKSEVEPDSGVRCSFVEAIWWTVFQGSFAFYLVQCLIICGFEMNNFIAAVKYNGPNDLASLLLILQLSCMLGLMAYQLQFLQSLILITEEGKLYENAWKELLKEW